jgi:hypothetical protein
MKNNLLFLLSTLFMLPLCTLAQKTGNLVIFSENGEKFIVSVDGDQKNETPQSNVRVEGLVGDFHRIMVDFEDDSYGTVSQNFMLDPGTEQKAQVMMKKNGKWAIRPFGEPVAIKSAPEPTAEPAPRQQKVAYQEKAVPAEKTTVTTTTTTSPQSAGESVDMQIGVGDQSIGVSVRVNDGSMTGSTQTTVTETRTTTSETTSGWEETEGEVVVDDCGPMAGGDFQSALESLKSKTFSDSRMTQAKQILNSNCMSADQIKTVMKAFEYEDDKLEFAKVAYDRCADPENYWKVNDAFEFEMTIDELNEYIESK